MPSKIMTGEKLKVELFLKFTHTCSSNSAVALPRRRSLGIDSERSDIKQARVLAGTKGGSWQRQKSLSVGCCKPGSIAAARARPVIAFSDGIRYDDCMPASLLQL